ncbi:MAG TPA: hypothetical protein VHS56_09020 [Candidatus Cybelea sp.]|nr:hypothetical protein [Candidatus Cybelea sp.]
MELRFGGALIPATVLALALSACGAQVPSTGGAVSPALPAATARARHVPLTDEKSVLKILTKDVTIGSTVDAKNGDQAPRALSIAHGSPHGVLTKGQLVVCNFEDSSGNAGAGTTIEYLDPTAGAKPQRFAQNAALKGCDGAAVHPHDGTVYGAALTTDELVDLGKKGAMVKSYGGKLFADPFSDIITNPSQNFSPLYVYVGTTSGTIVSVSVGFYGNGVATEVAKGFATNKGSQGWLAPSGFQYDQDSDTLYIVDGVSNTVVAFNNASDLLDKDEIIVQPGGKTFKCRYPKTTCGSVVYSGSPLNGPMASALLPNGNLIVANTQGTANTLVELTPAGKVLDTKVIDSSSTQGVFGLAAKGTTDSNTVLYYTDTNDNSVHELTH